MSGLDSGRISGPLLVFGGPYGNLEATRAMRDEAARLGIPPERTLCTGDLAAYCAEPAATVALIRDWGVAVVMGNVEEALALDAGNCGCGFAPGSACDAASAAWYRHATAEIAAADRRWMAGLPRRIDAVMAGLRLSFVHGAASSINRFVFASTPSADKRAELALAGADAVVGGHCGLPFAGGAPGPLWANAGAIGMPANDGTARVWFALLTEVAGGVQVELRPLVYDAEAAAAKMRRASLPAGYASALTTGLWPSLDILPPPERAATGVALAPARAHWPAVRRTRAAA